MLSARYPAIPPEMSATEAQPGLDFKLSKPRVSPSASTPSCTVLSLSLNVVASLCHSASLNSSARSSSSSLPRSPFFPPPSSSRMRRRCFSGQQQHPPENYPRNVKFRFPFAPFRLHSTARFSVQNEVRNEVQNDSRMGSRNGAKKGVASGDPKPPEKWDYSRELLFKV